MTAEPPHHHDAMDAFFASYYAHHPVNATFIGARGHDHRWPDFSEHGLGDRLADQADVRERLEGAPEHDAPAARTDRRLALGFLDILDWEVGSAHFERGNPSLYTGEAVFGVMGLFLGHGGPIRERVEAATERMEGVALLLAQARDNVRDAPASWTARAVRECDGALAFFTEGVAALDAELGGTPPSFTAAAARAARAVSEHRARLSTVLPERTGGGYDCGPEALATYLERGHFLSEGALDIARYAEAQLAEAEAHLRERAPDFGASTPSEAMERLRDLHPDAGSYYGRYRAVWDEVRTIADERRLLTWPDFPVRYVPRPGWARAAAPHLYFLFYRSPAAFRRPPVHDYLVAPLPEGDAEAFLQANNDSVIKLNHVIHHGGLGHHVQNWHAFRAESRIGRIAAVDCASRIAMFCGGTMAEGWACYATDLAGEAGALTPLERYAEVHGRVRMAVRAVVDVRLHRGEMTLDQAAALYQERAGMGAGAARGEAVKNSMFPGTALMYLMGTDAIHRLRRETERRLGSKFDLRAFHDELLSYGSIPVSLIAEDMTRSPIDDE